MEGQNQNQNRKQKLFFSYRGSELEPSYENKKMRTQQYSKQQCSKQQSLLPFLNYDSFFVQKQILIKNQRY